MDYKTFFLAEFDREMPNVKKTIERIPDDKLGWTPHDKSMPLGKLALHVATLPGFAVNILSSDSIDMAGFKGREPLGSIAEILAAFDETAEKARKAIEAADEADFSKTWTMKRGDTVFLSMSKAEAMQVLFLNHLVHHRAQLGVYLRLLDIPVPGMYGPSADER